MNEADRGRHTTAAALLTESAQTAQRAGRTRQQAWSLGILARSLLLSGQAQQARAAADASIALAHRERWNAFLPWSQVMRAQAMAAADDWDAASREAETAFALACELGDPCWEGMAGCALGLISLHAGDHATSQNWITDARRRCDRVSDRYVWVSAYIGLANLDWPSATAPAGPHPPRPSSTPTRRAPICPSSWPGRWSIGPNSATAARSLSRTPPPRASRTRSSRPGSRP
jgi:ATP/maltotriose-dependent transcriptional regulator MalT